MKKISLIFLLIFTNLSAEDFRLEKIIKGLKSPWSLSFIDNNNSNNLFVRALSGNIYYDATEHYMRNAGGTENMLKATTDGAVELYHDNVKTFETDANGIKLLGPEGGEAEVNLFADEGDDNADKWRIQALASGGLNIQNFTSGSWENNLIAYGNGAVELYHDNTKKFETASYGVLSAGQVRVSASNAATVAFSVGDEGTGFYNTGSNAI